MLELPDLTSRTVRLDLTASQSQRYRTYVSRLLRDPATRTSRTRLFTAVDRVRRRCSSWASQWSCGETLRGADHYITDTTDVAMVRTKIAEDRCPICLESIEHPGMVQECKHVFCAGCIARSMQAGNAACPMCRGPILRPVLTIAPDEEEEKEEAHDAEPVGDDPKLAYVLAEIARSDPDDKFVIFSNYKATLRALEEALADARVSCATLLGSPSVRRRAEIMKGFRSTATRVLLLPLRSTAVGLNIVEANRVVLMEPCLAPSMERQAIGCCWRMGQTRPVRPAPRARRHRRREDHRRGAPPPVHGSERVLQTDRDTVRWNQERLRLLRTLKKKGELFFNCL